MFKELKKYQVRLTPFQAPVDWNLNNTVNEDLLLFESTGSDDGEPLDLEYIDYTSGYPVDNYDCQIALEQQNADQVVLKEGEIGYGPFYPETEPVNSDGTFKRVVYSQIKTTFYNDYRDPSKIWGVEVLDFENSRTKRRLSDKLKVYEIPRSVFGDRMTVGTIRITDTSLDNDYTIVDDGYGNLVAQRNIFSKQQEIGYFTNNFESGSNSVCDAYFSSSTASCMTWDEAVSVWEDTIQNWEDCSSSSILLLPPTNLVVVSGSAILTWNDNSDNEDGFVIEKSFDGITYSQYVTTSVNVTHSIDSDVETPNTYWYRVFAYNSVTESTYSNTASITFVTESYFLPPPSDLVVESGSSILTWQDNSSDEDGFVIEKSLNGTNYSQYITTSANVTYSVDSNVTESNTYWYRVFAYNAITESTYSNTASITFDVPTSSTCPTASFDALIISGTFSTSNTTIYNNNYGVDIPFNIPTSDEPISIWARTSDFNAAITLVDTASNELEYSEVNGLTLSGDDINAAVGYQTPTSGTYTIEVSSTDNGTGQYQVYVSPGAKQKVIWGGYSPETTLYIPTTNTICIAEADSNVVFYDATSETITQNYTLVTCNDAIYSPVQDKVYVFGADFTGSFVNIYDNTGSFITASYLSGVTWGGRMIYDSDKDRIVFYSIEVGTYDAVIFDISTLTEIQTIDLSSYIQGSSIVDGTYSITNESYYLSQHTVGPTVGYMVKIDANSYTASNTTIKTYGGMMSYIDEIGLIAQHYSSSRGLQFYNPTNDTVTHSYPIIFDTPVFAGAVYCPCNDSVVVGFDYNDGLSSGLMVIDNNFTMSNFISTRTTPLDILSGSLFIYSLCYNTLDKYVYVSHGDFETNLLTSVPISIPSSSSIFNPPFPCDGNAGIDNLEWTVAKFGYGIPPAAGLSGSATGSVGEYWVYSTQVANAAVDISSSLCNPTTESYDLTISASYEITMAAISGSNVQIRLQIGSDYDYRTYTYPSSSGTFTDTFMFTRTIYSQSAGTLVRINNVGVGSDISGSFILGTGSLSIPIVPSSLTLTSSI